MVHQEQMELQPVDLVGYGMAMVAALAEKVVIVPQLIQPMVLQKPEPVVVQAAMLPPTSPRLPATAVRELVPRVAD